MHYWNADIFFVLIAQNNGQSNKAIALTAESKYNTCKRKKDKRYL